MLDHLIRTNQYFCFTGEGQLLTVEDLLTKKLGRPVGYDEAVQYIQTEQEKLKKSYFINHLMQRKNELLHATN